MSISTGMAGGSMELRLFLPRPAPRQLQAQAAVRPEPRSSDLRNIARTRLAPYGFERDHPDFLFHGAIVLGSEYPQAVFTSSSRLRIAMLARTPPSNFLDPSIATKQSSFRHV